ncbi:MAG: pilin [Pseudoxanthomonas sp.]|nr:pilin [Pseudoxanthomonas sp.]
MLTAPGENRLDGKALWFEYSLSNDSWQCSSEIENRYLPVSCRG